VSIKEKKEDAAASLVPIGQFVSFQKKKKEEISFH